MTKECCLAHPKLNFWRTCAYLGLDLKCEASIEQYQLCKCREGEKKWITGAY